MATPIDAASRRAGEPAEGTGPPVVAETEPVEKMDGEKPEACVVIDVKCDGSEDSTESKTESVCRICHLSPGMDIGASAGGGLGGAELIQIGCGCRGELAVAHRHCAEAWFRVKGNRCCEICGSNAKNINGEEDSNFMEEWHERRMLADGRRRNSTERSSCWRGQPFCNFLMACLVIAFILPWFFRVNIF